MADEAKPVGRPSLYSRELAEKICDCFVLQVRSSLELKATPWAAFRKRTDKPTY